MTGKNATTVLRADAAGIAEAVAILRDDGVVAVPTETVYGLAARADSDEAVAKIYAAKGRPAENPLIVHVASLDQARALAQFDDRAESLAAQFWPGPMTLVLPRRKDARLAGAVSGGLDTIALRMPAHRVMRALLEASDLPLAAPSANRSGQVSPTAARHVLMTLDGRVDAIIDGGECDHGLESTIVAVRGDGSWQVLRPGPITDSQLEAILGPPDLAAKRGIESPGQFASHYAPGKPVRLNADAARENEYFIGFGAIDGDSNLSPAGDLVEAAHALYACLHRAASASQERVAVAPVPETGLGRAINDRLRRAAA